MAQNKWWIMLDSSWNAIEMLSLDWIHKWSNFSRCSCFQREPRLMAERSSSSSLVGVCGENSATNRKRNVILSKTVLSGSVKPVRLHESCRNCSRIGEVSFSCFASWRLSTFLRHFFLCLLMSGAFLAGVPVQPVLLRYPNKVVSAINGEKSLRPRWM